MIIIVFLAKLMNTLKFYFFCHNSLHLNYIFQTHIESNIFEYFKKSDCVGVYLNRFSFVLYELVLVSIFIYLFNYLKFFSSSLSWF